MNRTRDTVRTRENMSPELKRELREIESNEYALLVRSGLDEALKTVAYLHSTLGPTTYPHNAQDKNPFEVEFYWDDPVFGSIAKMDLRRDLLERFSDDPEVYKDVIATAEKAMRAFADELAALLEPPK